MDGRCIRHLAKRYARPGNHALFALCRAIQTHQAHQGRPCCRHETGQLIKIACLFCLQGSKHLSLDGRQAWVCRTQGKKNASVGEV